MSQTTKNLCKKEYRICFTVFLISFVLVLFPEEHKKMLLTLTLLHISSKPLCTNYFSVSFQFSGAAWLGLGKKNAF